MRSSRGGSTCAIAAALHRFFFAERRASAAIMLGSGPAG
jgi:hypothetical protein